MQLWHVCWYCYDGGAVIWGERGRWCVVFLVGWWGFCDCFLISVSSHRSYDPPVSGLWWGRALGECGLSCIILVFLSILTLYGCVWFPWGGILWVWSGCSIGDASQKPCCAYLSYWMCQLLWVDVDMCSCRVFLVAWLCVVLFVIYRMCLVQCDSSWFVSSFFIVLGWFVYILLCSGVSFGEAWR